MANFINFESSHQVFLLAANFHNSSLSYLTSLNLSLNISPKEKSGIKSSFSREKLENKELTQINPKQAEVNITEVHLGHPNVLVKSTTHKKASNYEENGINADSEFGQPNSYKRTSKETEPQSKHETFSFSSAQNKSETDVRDFNSKRQGSSMNINFQIENNFSDSTSFGKNNSLRPVNGRSALTYEDSALNGQNIIRKSKNTISDGIVPNLGDYVHRRPYDTRHSKARAVTQDHAISDNSNNVNQQWISEEVRLPGNDNIGSRERVQTETVVNEIKHINNEDNTNFKGTFETLSNRRRGLHGALSKRGNQYNVELDNKQLTSETQGRYKFDVIQSQSEPQRLPDSLSEHDVKAEWRFNSFENQAALSDAINRGEASIKEGFTLDPGCRSRYTGFEDILCMKRPEFLSSFRNPCWYENRYLRCLPYFHIIGVCKTGTTDLFERLSHHPQIIKNNGILGKETWYWTWKRYGHTHFHRQITDHMTFENFIDIFDARSIERFTKRLFNGSEYHPAVTGHGDPMDVWDQTSWKLIPQNNPTSDVPEVTTPSLIKHVNPKIKLILLLRDPVERLFSNYLHGQFGTSSAEFHQDVLASLSLLTSCTRSRSMKSCLYDENIIRNLQVPISGSFYSIHLQEWLRVFPRKQIYITRTEDFSKNIADTLLGIFRFLKLDPLPTRELYRIANMPHYYDTKAKQTAGEILDETRTVLRSLFKPYNNELAALLNDQKFNFNNS